jgi:GTP-binding protein
VVLTSSASGLGLDELRGEIQRRLPDAAPPAPVPDTPQAEHRVFRPAAERAYEVKRVGHGVFAVNGPGIERLLARYDLDNEDAMAYLERRLKGIGVLDALAAEGFEPGDEVQIAGVPFDLDPGL